MDLDNISLLKIPDSFIVAHPFKAVASEKLYSKQNKNNALDQVIMKSVNPS
jgi:hypothetical protein